MRILTSTTGCAVIMVFLAPGLGTAQCTGELNCHESEVPDPLHLHKCLQGTLDACGVPGTETESPDQKLSECFLKPQTMTRISFLFLYAVRETIQLSLGLLSPGSGSRLFMLLQLVQKELEGRGIQSRSLQESGCDKKIKLRLPENASISECTKLMDAYCGPHKPREPRDWRPFLLFSALVCFLKNIPTISAMALLKGMICTVLKASIIIIKKTRMSLLMLPVLEFLQVVLRCEAYKPLSKFAERSLLSE